MNWLKENPFLSGLLAACVVGAGLFGTLIFQSASAYFASVEEYNSAVTKLHTLQNKSPFPSEQNLKAVQVALDDYAKSIRALRSGLAKMEMPLDEKVTPQQFMDGLRKAVNDLRAKAETNQVKLPANFFFGFDQYQTQVPTEQCTPFLDRQFRIIQSIVSRLVDFKVASIEGVVRPPLPQESTAPAAAANKPAKDAPQAPVLQRFPFEIAFTAEQGKFRVAFNSLLGSEQFLVVRSVSLSNSAPQAPSKKGPEAAAPASTNPFATDASTGGKNAKDQGSLQVILGRELLKANLRLEMLDFSEPEAAQQK